MSRILNVPVTTANIVGWVRHVATSLNQLIGDHESYVAAPSVPTYTVATLPAATAGALIYVSDETGGAVLAFGDGTNFRRVTDRAIVA